MVVEQGAVDELPPGISGRAAVIAVEHQRASQALSGLLAAPGRTLIATITSDDLAWARQMWLSIRAWAAPFPSRAERRTARRRKGGAGV